eukprot:3039175-Rhodomonas_salina.1
MVITSPAVARSTSVWKVTVSVFQTARKGFVWPMSLTSNVGYSTLGGSVPFGTPSKTLPGEVMSAATMVASLAPASTRPSSVTTEAA